MKARNFRDNREFLEDLNKYLLLRGDLLRFIAPPVAVLKRFISWYPEHLPSCPDCH
jgi:hypothetical protein